MSRNDSCIVVFTTEGPQDIIAEGGTQHWKISQWRESQNEYVVCVRNAHNVYSPDDGIPHNQAFLVGRVNGFVPSGEKDRTRITISEWAAVSIPDCWNGDRFPVRYRTLGELGIDPDTLDFKPVSSVPVKKTAPSLNEILREMKANVAERLGLPTSMIEISIRA